MDKLLSILSEIKPGVDFANEKALFTDRILDSFDIMSIVTEITDEFDIKIRPADLIPENSDSVESIMALIERIK